MKTFSTTNLIEIFQTLTPLVAQTNDYELSEELAQAKTTYTTMLHFLVKGTDDPNAPTIYNDLQTKAYAIHDRAQRLLRLQQNKSDKYTLTHTQHTATPPFTTLVQILLQQTETILHTQQDPTLRDTQCTHNLAQLYTDNEATLENLFEQVWTSDLWTESDYQAATLLLDYDINADQARCLLVSAVTLALQEMFDPRKLMYLIDAYLNPSVPVNQRALVGIILTLRQWDQRIQVYPQLAARLTMLTDDANFSRETYRCLMQLQYSKLTDTISAKMQHDIIPTIMNSTHFKHTPFGIQEIDDYMTKHGENPEWHHKDTDTQAQTSLQEMANLQIDGADIYMSAFSHMKNHPFFRQIGHWFLPFNIHSHYLPPMQEQEETATTLLLQTILRDAPFCDSDKYSFALMLNHLGSVGRNQFTNTITSNLSSDEITELTHHTPTHTKPNPAIVSRHYIFDLYRFFQLYPYHQQFTDPFSQNAPSFTPLHTQTLAPLLQDRTNIQQLADFLMRKALYPQALQLYATLHPQPQEADADLWQRMGFCEQKQGHNQQAYQYYTQAYQLNPQSNWTLKHLASAALQQAEYTEANTLYDLLLAQQPDNLHYLTLKIQCLMHMQHYAQALPLLYKANYLDETSTQIRQQLAHCELLNNHPDKALQHIQQLLTQHPDYPAAWLQLATIHITQNHIPQAYQALHKAYQLNQNQENTTTFQQQYHTIVPTLQTLRVSPQKIQMLYDAVTTHLPIDPTTKN